MRYLLAFLMLTTAARADSIWTNTMGLNTVSTCQSNGDKWYEMGTICHSDPMFRKNPPSGIGSDAGGAITSMSRPDCEAGWSAVLDAAGHPMCARELREPK
jgi:hypothetical protein